ncbi:MAG: hypothetical protein HGN29_17270, partial [Asgard group archaeon]|nr:hypothetical protein [Asgard group archaeon]
LEQQTVNPTSSPITIPYVCSPLPFPYLRTNLRNKSLIVKHEFTFQWPIDELTLPPGYYRNRTKYVYFKVEDYLNKSLPLGTYEMWFDYTNCSFSPVPVVIEKMYVDVTETSVTYYFDYNDETRIVSSLQQSNYVIPFFVFASCI